MLVVSVQHIWIETIGSNELRVPGIEILSIEFMWVFNDWH